MFVVSIFQRFSFTWDPTQPKPKLDVQIAGEAAPLPHQLILMERKARPSKAA